MRRKKYQQCSGCGAFAESAAADVMAYLCPTCGGTFESTRSQPDPSDPFERPYHVRDLLPEEPYSTQLQRVI